MYFLRDVCELSEVLKVIYFVKQLLNIVCFLVPIGLIVMISLDFVKNVIAKDEGEMRKNLNLVIKRILMAVMVFLVPTIVTFLNTLLGSLGLASADCFKNATLDKISAFEAEEKAILEAKKNENQNQENQPNSSGLGGATPDGGNQSATGNGATPNNSDVDDTGSGTSAGGNDTGNNSNVGGTSVVDNTGADSGADFSKIGQCHKGSVASSSGNIKLRECVSGYKTPFFQNISITDHYVYFSRLSTQSSGNTVINQNKVARVSRTNNTYQVMRVRYAGHAQSFDVANLSAVDSSGNYVDELYLNYFTGYNKGLVPKQYNNGVTCSQFAGEGNDNGYLKIPELAIAILNSGKSGSSFHTPSSLKLVKSSSYLGSDGKIDTSSYNSQVEKIGKNQSSYVRNAQIAVDESHNQLLLFNNNKRGYVYKLSDFKNGKLSLITSFSMDVGYGQGVDIYGNYVYYFRGGQNGNLSLIKYNIKTGKSVLSKQFSLSSYVSKKGLRGYEPEGISVYNGKVYVAIYYNKSGTTYAGIFYVDGV